MASMGGTGGLTLSDRNTWPACHVGEQNAAGQHIVEPDARVGVLGGPGVVIVGHRVSGFGQFQTGRGAGQGLDGLLLEFPRLVDVFVHVPHQHVRVEGIGGEVGRDEVVRDAAGLGAAPGGAGLIGERLQVGREEVERLREAGHGDLRFEEIAREIAVVTKSGEVLVHQPGLGSHDGISAGHRTAFAAPGDRTDRHIVTGQVAADEVGHLEPEVLGHFLEPDDVRLEISQLAADGLDVGGGQRSSPTRRCPRCCRSARRNGDGGVVGEEDHVEAQRAAGAVGAAGIAGNIPAAGLGPSAVLSNSVTKRTPKFGLFSTPGTPTKLADWPLTHVSARHGDDLEVNEVGAVGGVLETGVFAGGVAVAQVPAQRDVAVADGRDIEADAVLLVLGALSGPGGDAPVAVVSVRGSDGRRSEAVNVAADASDQRGGADANGRRGGAGGGIVVRNRAVEVPEGNGGGRGTCNRERSGHEQEEAVTFS